VIGVAPEGVEQPNRLDDLVLMAAIWVEASSNAVEDLRRQDTQQRRTRIRPAGEDGAPQNSAVGRREDAHCDRDSRPF